MLRHGFAWSKDNFADLQCHKAAPIAANPLNPRSAVISSQLVSGTRYLEYMSVKHRVHPLEIGPAL